MRDMRTTMAADRDRSHWLCAAAGCGGGSNSEVKQDAGTGGSS